MLKKQFHGEKEQIGQTPFKKDFSLCSAYLVP
jgi:hypothetical protein